jgi:uncharacterized Zn finger protein
VPCKHLAATFYLLAESFDDDPFAILAWRGREREDLLANLQTARSDGPPAADQAGAASRPLADCLDSYSDTAANATRDERRHAWRSMPGACPPRCLTGA